MYNLISNPCTVGGDFVKTLAPVEGQVNLHIPQSGVEFILKIKRVKC